MQEKGSECVAPRREFLARAGSGFGLVALASLLDGHGLLAAGDATRPSGPRLGHFPARARSVIWLFMEGGPSAVDLFDPKPSLERYHGTRLKGIETFGGDPGPVMKSPFSFRRHGQSDAWICDRLPALARHADDLSFVRSVRAESNNHAPAMYQVNTGMTRMGFPSVGSWVTYGLGSENANLPGFVVLQNARGTKGGPLNWSSGFLPGSYQGTLFRSEGAPLLFLGRPQGISSDTRGAQIDLIAGLNRDHLERHLGLPELEARISAFELAYRMQAEAVDLTDLNKEPRETQRLYGLDDPRTRPFGRKCLLARRLVERGVRFVQVYVDDDWDGHQDIADNHGRRCLETDVPIAGLLSDLKRRGLLDTTLVVWGGEFGRMPLSEKGGGRDHNPDGFLMWMAGGGVRGGASFGATDEFGHKAVVDPVSIHDLHATLLHLLGMDHTKLTYLHNGRRFRLTDVAGRVLQPLLA